MQLKFSTKAKQAISSLALITVLTTTTQSGAGVPVFDAANVAQAISQVQNQIRQIEQMRRQIRAITDNGNYAQLLDNPQLRKALNRYLPSQYNDIFEAARRGDLGALRQVVEKAKQREQRAKDQQTGAERVAAVRFLSEAQLEVGYDRLQKRGQALDSLIGQINMTTNPAQKADLTNSLVAQSALINTEIGQIQLQMQVAQRQEQAAARQANIEAYKEVRKSQIEYIKKKNPNSLR